MYPQPTAPCAIANPTFGMGPGVGLSQTLSGPNDIVSVTEGDIGRALLHYGAAHGLSVDVLIYVISGTFQSVYANGPFTVTATPTATTIYVENSDGTLFYNGNASGVSAIVDAAFNGVNDLGGGKFRFICDRDLTGIIGVGDHFTVHGGIYNGLTFTADADTSGSNLVVVGTFAGDSSGGVKKV